MRLGHWRSKIVTDLRGAWSRLDLIKAKANRGFSAINVRFPPGRVLTRDGYANRLAVSAKVTSMYNWLTSGLNQVIYTRNTNVRSYSVDLAVDTDLYTVAGTRAAVVAEGGPRAYIALFNTSSLGQAQARVINGGLAGLPADKAFAGPMQVTSIVGTEPSAGTVTAGTHKFGFVMQSRTGFAGYPSPINGSGVFTPLSKVCAGSKILRLTVTANTPSDAAFAYPVMTRADNPNKWYFVPTGVNGGDPAGLPPSTAAFSWFWDINITDEDLANRATSADDNFSLSVQDVSGNGPFSPGFVKAYGKRMVYIADTDIWISDEDAQQSLTTAQHKVQMPGVRRIIGALVIRGVIYLIGPKWTYSLSNRAGATPKTWGAPQLVSGAIGTIAPKGMTDRTAGDYGWVATVPGLFKFAGVYEEKPITYLDAAWGTINWAAGYGIQVEDDFLKQRVYVAAPLGVETEPSKMFVIDYSRGMTPYDVDISLDIYNGAMFAGNLFSSIALVSEVNGIPTLWVGPAASGQIVKAVDGSHSDAGAEIQFYYETGRVLDAGDTQAQSNRLGRLQLGIKGSGSVTVHAYSQDRIRNAAYNLTLAAAPDVDADDQLDLSDVDNFSVGIGSNGIIGAWMDLSRIKPYYRGQWTNR